jgi:hypothetical protein
MVSPVDPSATAARMAALMQRVFGGAPLRPAGREAGAPSTAAPSAPPRATLAGEASAAETLKSRVRGIGRDHPDRRRAVVRLLIETVLTEEFGAAVVNDPLYQGLIDDVAGAFEEMPELRGDLDRVVQELIRGN